MRIEPAAQNETARFRASLRHARGYGYTFVFVMVLLLCGTVVIDRFLLMPAVLLTIYAAVIEFRLTIELQSDRLVYRGWFGKKEIRFRDIRSVRWMKDVGYPQDRLFGPNVCRISSETASITVNLLLFNHSCNREFLERIHAT